MDQLLVSLISECLAKAQSLGLTATNTIVLSSGSTDANSVNIYVSYLEPNGSELPLNFMWLVADVNSGDYRKIFKRVSRSAVPPYNNSYVTMTTYTSVMSSVAEYDQPAFIRAATLNHTGAVGNVHNMTPTQLGAVSLSGDRMLGALLTRQNWRTVALTSDELIPNQRLIDAQNSQTNGFYTIIMQLNTRLTNVENELRNLKLGKIAEFESRIAQLELVGGGELDIGLIPRTYVHNQETEEVLWIVNHNLGTKDLIVQYWVLNDFPDGPQYEMATAETITMLDDDFLVVEHNMPVKGKVVILEAALEEDSALNG